MAHEDDSRSDSSWDVVQGLEFGAGFSRCDDDARSDSSWNVLGNRDLGLRLRRGDDDSHSDASWDYGLETQTMSFSQDEVLAGPCETAATTLIHDVDVCSQDSPCLRHAGISFNKLVAAGQWECAVRLLRTSPEPKELALQRDDAGDSALSWAVYKSKNSRGSACLQLICHLLMLCPTEVSKRSSNRFLPLHEAAWGNAPAAIGTLLCAALPAALHDVSCGQTPHQVGTYHHTKLSTQRSGRTRWIQQISFSWPAPETMMKDALDLRAKSQWLQALALRLSSVSDVRSLSAKELQLSLDVPEPFAVLLLDYFNPQPLQASPPSGLSSIPECSDSTAGRRRCRLPKRAFKRASVDDKNNPVEPCELDVVEHLQERVRRVRNERMLRVRNSRSGFTQLMTIVDGADAVHHLILHSRRAMSTMPRTLQQRMEELKWPSKLALKRERAYERLQKTYYDRLPAESDAVMGW